MPLVESALRDACTRHCECEHGPRVVDVLDGCTTIAKSRYGSHGDGNQRDLAHDPPPPFPQIDDDDDDTSGDIDSDDDGEEEEVVMIV